ncbi:MAG: ribosome silencing factor [Bacteroidetes bacterium]|jgi:ribosome-associated protein|nr:ribosome silencing factor [Bacteroidota bacterium]
MASPNQMTSSSSAPSPSRRRIPDNPGHVLAAQAVDAMADKKAADITVLDLRGVSGMADFFVIGTGGSDLQIRAIANGVMDRIREECDERPYKKEGLESLQWVLIDYVDVVVHVFSKEKREHYNIERLWGEADAETVPQDGDAGDIQLLQSLLSKDSDA